MGAVMKLMTKTLFTLVMMLMTITSCTISFQNISTHGTTTDLVDEENNASADVKPNLNLTSGLL